MNISKLIESVDPGIYERLKQAVEVGKWANGIALSSEQKALCLRAIIAYDIKYKPEHERVGYVTSSGVCGNSSSADTSEYRPIKIPGH